MLKKDTSLDRDTFERDVKLQCSARVIVLVGVFWLYMPGYTYCTSMISVCYSSIVTMEKMSPITSLLLLWFY